jgi:putative SOS response-associated peptidase YedK
MPAILTLPEEWETWLTAPWTEARTLQRPLPDGALRIVARGGRTRFQRSGGPPTTVLRCSSARLIALAKQQLSGQVRDPTT